MVFVIVGVFGPLTNDHVPVPTVAAIAAIVVVVTLHKFWSAPANANDGKSFIVTKTSSVEVGHVPLVIVQRKP